MQQKWASAAKYTIHHLHFSDVAPQWCYVAGQDSECAVGRWDRGGSAGPATGNSNSSSGGHGHGRAVGPAGLQSLLGGADADDAAAAGAAVGYRPGEMGA
jgi:hypothetical protein